MNALKWLKSIFQRKPKNKFNAKVETDNIVLGIANAKALHRRLVIMAHPDKNPSQRELAEEITKLINKNKYNYNELVRLEQRIKTEMK